MAARDYRVLLEAPAPPVQSDNVGWAENVGVRMGTTWRLLLKELSAFGIVGAVCFGIDIVLFQVLYVHVGLGAVTAKLLATLVSMTVAYVAHRYWSFSHRARTGVRREYALFGLVNAATLLLNVGAVWLVRYPLGQDSAFLLQLANVASIAVGTVIRYLSYRRWVFPALPAVTVATMSPEALSG
ncbi:MAG: GtrA family protein [Blastococcus sp.]|jgi:putative flippase GtrA